MQGAGSSWLKNNIMPTQTESKKDHLCILAAAKEEIPVFGPKIVIRGL